MRMMIGTMRVTVVIVDMVMIGIKVVNPGSTARMPSSPDQP